MTITRISDAQTFGLLVDRTDQLQVTIQRLQQQISSGEKLFSPEDDPLGAAQATRVRSTISSLAQFASASQFGTQVLGAEDKALGDAENVLVRGEEIATQQASGLVSQSERDAAREEVHGLLQALTAAGNTELAGRRLFAGLALDVQAPFADPASPGYTPATAFDSRYTQDFFVQTGSGSGERVRLTTRGDQVFQRGLQALSDLDAALAPGGDVAATLAELKQGRDDLAAERASVAARQSQLVGRSSQLDALKVQEQQSLSDVVDVDLVSVITRLTQAQTALQATLAAGSQVVQTSLSNLLRL